MGDIGNQLREAREAQRLSLTEVERETRIRRVFLQALEDERFGDLPGDVYTRGFIRNYALFVNLDPQPLLDEFDRLRTAPHHDDAEVLDEPLVPERSVNVGARVLIILMALLVLFLVGWYVYNRLVGGPSPADLLRSWGVSLGQTSAPTPEPTLALTTDTPEPEATLPTTAPTLTPSPAEATATRTAFPTRTPTAISGILVVVDVLEDSWMHVILDDEVAFDGTLQVGEQITWQAQSLVDISIGNAGGISMTVNNVLLGMLGLSGEVIEVSYTLDSLPTPAP